MTEDRFAAGIFVFAALLWLTTVLPAILTNTAYNLLAIFFVALSALVAFIAFVIWLFMRRWLVAFAMASAVALFFGLTLQALRNSDEIRWTLLHSRYKDQIDHAKIGPSGTKGIWWNGGSGWDVSLEYHEDEAAALAWQTKQHGWMGTCKFSLKQMAPHYFLNGVYC
jgi:hypothetical protein